MSTKPFYLRLQPEYFIVDGITRIGDSSEPTAVGQFPRVQSWEDFGVPPADEMLQQRQGLVVEGKVESQ